MTTDITFETSSPNENKTFNKKQNPFLPIIWGLGTGFIIIFILLLINLFAAHGAVEKTISSNTLILQDTLDDIIHYIDLYEISQNENYLILLQGELNRADVLFEQTKSLSDTHQPLKHIPSKVKVHETIETTIFYLEETLKKKIEFTPSTVLQLREELSYIDNEISKKPTSDFTEFVCTTNKHLEKLRSTW